MLRKFMARIPQKLKAANNHAERKSLLQRCLCTIVVIGLLMLYGGQSVQAEQSWPSIKDVSASGRDWGQLSDLGLSSREFGEVRRITADWLDRHCWQTHDDKVRVKRIAAIASKRIQLQDNSSSQLAVREDSDWEGDSESCSCGPNLNCHTWLVDFSGKRATTLLEYRGFGIVVLNASSYGYFDLVTGSIRQKGTVDLTHWRFNGAHYKPLACASEHYSEPSNGEVTADNSVPAEHPCR